MWKHKTLVNLLRNPKSWAATNHSSHTNKSWSSNKEQRVALAATSLKEIWWRQPPQMSGGKICQAAVVLEEMCAIWDIVSPQLPPILYLILLPFWSRAWSKDYCILFLESFVRLRSNKNQTAWVNTSDLPFPATKTLLGTWPHNASPTIKQAKALPATGPNTTMALLA